MIPLVALQKHWHTMDAVGRFEADPPLDGKLRVGSNQPLSQSTFMRTSVWLGLLYVVVEGYRELRLQDHRVDYFLSFSDRVEELRRFRNCIFHYQSDPDDARLGAFLNREACLGWAHELSRAIDALLTRELASVSGGA